ncbi:nitroreductase [Streptomyces piniterrae]|uniref:Nitroreductase n=1 Tax=Streptomyces piniterrae TaxID=2571125 RepID=A0A4U0NXA9_9ACTN|nr:nitroreductase family protein [Streptomyces piniterrae]TJZ59389.1 nitroreductase [Streptomyces piniterrae]
MHNAQPWHFRYFRGSRVFHVRADFDRVMPHADPDTRALHLGCGAALFNLRVAVVHEGWYPATQVLPDQTDPALLATVQLIGLGSDESGLAALYPAIHQRHTSRFPFEETEIPQSVRTALSGAAHIEGASLTFPTAWHLQELLDLVREAEARNLTDRASDQDLARWTHIDDSSERPAPDGVPDYAFGPRKLGGKAPMRDFAGTRPVAGRDAAEFEHSPHLALLSTAHDRPEDWVRAGQAMQRVLLLATLKGLSSSLATQPLEWTDLRWPLRDPISGEGHVQMLLRLGYGPKGTSTPRRPVSEVLDIEP